MRNINGFYDDVFSSASGAASTMANDAQSVGNWIGQEFNSLDQTLLGPFSAQGAIDAANADAAPGGAGYLGVPGAISDAGNFIEDNIIAPVENAFGTGFQEILLVGAGALLLYALVTHKGK